jgi:hypothetical protein
MASASTAQNKIVFGRRSSIDGTGVYLLRAEPAPFLARRGAPRISAPENER